MVPKNLLFTIRPNIKNKIWHKEFLFILFLQKTTPRQILKL